MWPAQSGSRLAALVSVLALLAGAPAAATISFEQPGFTADTVVSGLPYATGVAFAPDGRMFFALKSGVVLIHDGTALLSTPFIDISPIVNDAHDRGLLGIAVHPDFPAQPYVYLLFSHDPAGVAADVAAGGRVSRLIRVEADPAQGFNVALPGMTSEQTTPGGPGHWVMLGTNSTLANIGSVTNGRITTLASCMVGASMSNAPVEDCIPSDERSHSIGTVMFAPDGSLFVSSGDASNYTGVDRRALRARDRDSLAGKVLRIDPDTALGLPDNPFYDAADPGRNRSKVWAYGLRNPFRFGIHPTTSEPYIGDSGWNTWEEIARGKGANFGWPCYEGGVGSSAEGWLTESLRQPGYETAGTTSAACAALYSQGVGAVVPPAFAYNHAGTDGYGSTGGASSNAGAIYVPGTYPGSYDGALFIADYSRLWLRVLTLGPTGDVTGVENFARVTGGGVVQTLIGPDTNVWILQHAPGQSIFSRVRYVAGGNTPPTAVPTAAPVFGSAPLDVTFSAIGSFDPDAQDLYYDWDFGDGAVGSGLSATHTYTSAGTFLATLTVSEQTAPFASGTEQVAITVGASPPLAEITSPASGTTFAIGDSVPYAGSATTAGGPIPPSGLSWDARTHHNDHLHFDSLGSGAGGLFDITDHSDGVWYELCLTATDQGLTDTQCVSLLPRLTQVTVDSAPQGAGIVYEEVGQIIVAPTILEPTEGSTRTITAPTTHQWRSFDRWDDGLAARSRSFGVGAAPLSFTAEFVNLLPTAAFVPTNGGAGAARLAFSFDATSSTDPEGGALSFDWSFGDGASGSGAPASHTYAGPGSYLVTLTATDPVGGVGTATTTIDIANAPPSALVLASPTSGPAPLVVALDGSGSTDPDADALAYAWDFGDGTTAAGAVVSKTFATPGSYTVTLGVADPFAATSTQQVAINVGPANLPPIATGSASVPTGPGRLVVDFDGSASSDPDGAIAQYAWSFGDGASALGASTSHTYAAPGSYVATLTVTDDGGATDSAAIAVGIPNNSPNATFVASPTAGDAPLAVAFDGSASSDSDGDAVAYAWDFGNGATATGPVAAHTFNTPGVYTVTLAVADPFSAAGVHQETITVTTPPTMNAAPEPNAGPDRVVFLPNAAALAGSATDDGLPGGQLSFAWSLESGPAGGIASIQDASAATTSASFSVPGVYVLRLSVSDGALEVGDTMSVTAYGVASLTRSITNKNDDAEQFNGGTVSLTSNDLELVLDAGAPQTVGLRFPNLAIDAAAPILDAYVQFEVDEVTTGSASLTITGERALVPAAFSTLAFSISSRPRTAAAVPWAPAPWPTIQVAGLDQRTPNLAPILQEIVSQPGWASGSPVVLLFNGTGKRTAESSNGTRAPVLVVQYGTLPSAPNAAPLVNAGVDQTLSVLPASVTLSGSVSDDGFPSPPGSVTASWSLVSGPAAVTFSDPSAAITDAIFPAVGSYVVRLTGNDGALSASDDAVITVTTPGATILDRAVAKNDDAEERLGVVKLTDSDLELVLDASQPQTVLLRFANVTIPASATISNAYIQFEVDEVTTIATSLTVQGEANAAPAPLTTASFSLSSRPRTAASVAWVPAPWPTIQVAGPDQRTPNLAPVIQEILALPGWASGNAMAFVITGGGKRTAESANGTRAPVLHVEYMP